MAYCDKVLSHPDCREIEERLLSGESVRTVSSWIKSKYPNNKRNHISYLTLQRFRQDHLNLRGEVLKEIRETTTALTAERVEEQREMAVKESPTYQAAKLRIAHDVMNREQLILSLQDKIWQRIKMIENEELNYKTETVLAQYISELRQLLNDYHKQLVDWTKLEKRGGDSQVNVQVVLQQAEEQVNQLKIVVKEILQEMQPELIPVFLDKLAFRMEQLQSSRSSTVNVQVNNYAH